MFLYLLVKLTKIQINNTTDNKYTYKIGNI